MYKTNKDHDDIAKLLIEKGADTNAKDNPQVTELMLSNKDASGFVATFVATCHKITSYASEKFFSLFGSQESDVTSSSTDCAPEDLDCSGKAAELESSDI